MKEIWQKNLKLMTTMMMVREFSILNVHKSLCLLRILIERSLFYKKFEMICIKLYGKQHVNADILIYQIFKSILLQARPAAMYRNAKKGRKMNPLPLNLRNKLNIQTKVKSETKVLFCYLLLHISY